MEGIYVTNGGIPRWTRPFRTVDTIKMDLKLGLEGVYWFQFAPWRADVPSVVKLRFE